MMRIVHVSSSEPVVKSTAKEERYERRLLMMKNQKIEDVKKAEEILIDRLKSVRLRLINHKK
ncbi:hypothetical protein [Pedobacter sp. NJ-S-72]